MKDVVLSTRMNVIGCEEIESMGRRIWIMLALVVSAALGGMKMPSSRKDFMLLVRSRDEAEGESRIMGCTFWCGFFVRFDTRAGCGALGLWESGRERKNEAAVLRYREKSWGC